MKLRRGIVALVVAVALAVVPLRAQTFTAQIQQFWNMLSAGALAFTRINVSGETTSGVTATKSITTDVGATAIYGIDSALNVTGDGTGTNTMATLRGSYINSSVNATTSGIGLYGRARDTSSGRTTTKYGVYGEATNSATYSGSDGAVYGGHFTANHLTLAANNLTNLIGVYGGVFTAGDPGGTVSDASVFQAECDISTTIAGHSCTAFDVKRLNATAGGDVFGYRVRNNGAGTGMTGANIWAFRNDEESAPAYSASNWRAPFIANEASSVLASGATITPTNAVHHVSGTDAVVTITVPAMCSPTCTIYLIPDAAFTTTTAGNISLASIAVVNKVLIMLWDGAKWNPSY